MRPTDPGRTKVRVKKTSRGPQGLPTQAASTQKPAPKPKVVKARPAPRVQPGPVSNAERQTVNRYKSSPGYQQQVKQTARENAKPHPSFFQRVAKSVVDTLPVKIGIDATTHLPGAAGRLARNVDKQVSKELAGKGEAVKQSAKLADQVAKNGIIVPTGTGNVGVNAATGGQGNIASARPVPLNHAPILARTFKDMINFPAQFVPSFYVPVAGAAEAAQGHPARIKQFARDIKKTDPVYNLATGHPKKALKLAGQHPGFTALEVSGLKGTVGRVAGRTLRALPGDAASVTRKPQTFPGTDLRKEQTYSPDVIKKARQVRVENAQAKRAAKIRVKARQSNDVAEQQALHAKANKTDPFRMSNAEVRRRMDERVAVNEAVRRQNRAKATQQAHEAITNKGRGRGERAKPSAATSLAAQGIAKATPQDLAAFGDRIKTEGAGLEGAKRTANRQLVVQVKKAGKGNLRNVQTAAERYASDVAIPRQKALVARGVLDRQQQERSPLISYAVEKMGAKHNGDAVVARDGSALSNDQIRAHMQANGVKEPAYVTQAPGQRGARNFYVASNRPPSINGATRTGEAVRKGTFDAHPDTLIEGAARAQGLIDAADGFTATVSEFARRGSSGKVKTYENHTQAMNAARNLAASDGVRLRPVRLNPFAGRQAQLKALLDKANGDAPDAVVAGHQPVKEALESAIRGEPGPGKWTLIPEAAADQQLQHLSKLTVGPKGKALQLGSSAFRKTVLATNPSWFLGNTTEAGGRSAIARAGPLSYVRAKRVGGRLHEIDPVAAQELASRAADGGKYAMADRVHIRRDSTQFEGGKILEPVAKALGAFWRAPGPKQLADVWHGYSDIVFRSLNGRLESQFQTAMLGKALRDSPLMSGRGLRLSQKAIDEAAQGLRDTNNQVMFAREVERMYGKYNAFSPDMRGMISMYTPFIAWTLNAVKFVYDVLPRDHPTLTALTVITERATEEWRKQHGLDEFMQGAVPGWLQGSIPTKDGGHQRAPNRYLPFGAFGDPLGTMAGAVLPQASGILAAFKGTDWKGKALKNADGSSPPDVFTRANAAAASLIDSTVPAVAQAKRLAQGGPGALNPLKTVKAKKKTTAAGKSVTQQLGGASSTDVVKQLNRSGGSSVTDQLLNP